MVVSILVLQVDSDIRCRVYLIRSLIEAYQIAFLQSGVITLDQNGLLSVGVNINSVGGVGGVINLSRAVLLGDDTVNGVGRSTGRLGGESCICCNNLVIVGDNTVITILSQIEGIHVASGVGVEVTSSSLGILCRSSSLIYKQDCIRSCNLAVKRLGILIVEVGDLGICLRRSNYLGDLDLAVINVRILDQSAGLQSAAVTLVEPSVVESL